MKPKNFKELYHGIKCPGFGKCQYTEDAFAVWPHVVGGPGNAPNMTFRNWRIEERKSRKPVNRARAVIAAFLLNLSFRISGNSYRKEILSEYLEQFPLGERAS